MSEIPELEIGYHILRSRWGEGLATESAIACGDYAFDDLGRRRIISWMTQGNLASRRVAEKVGMGLEKETRSRIGTISVVYSMKPEER